MGTRLVRAITILTAVALTVISGISLEAKMDNLPRIPGAVLLLGESQTGLSIVTETAATNLPGAANRAVIPSMSVDGRFIASARAIGVDASAPRPRLTVGTYSVADKKWTDYDRLQVFDGTIAISPDGSRLACLSRGVAGAVPHLEILDLRTGKIRAESEPLESAGPNISWSPDGRFIAFDKEVKRQRDGDSIPPIRSVYVLDVDARTATRVADGASPSWSPSGDWIAFFDYSPGRDDRKKGWYATNANRLSLVRPNGTNFKVMVTFEPDEDLVLPPIWSPDSKSILLNRFRDEAKSSVRIDILNLANLNLSKKFGNAPPVYAWVRAK